MSERFIIPKYDCPGVYALVNLYDMVCYVGSTKNIKRRAADHKRYIENGNHPNKIVRESSKNDYFHFLILEKMPEGIEGLPLKTKELMFMVSMSWGGHFKMANKEVMGWGSTAHTMESVCNAFIYMSNTENICADAFQKEFNTKPYYLNNMTLEHRINYNANIN